MELTLNEKSKKSLERRIGITVSEMARMDVEELDKLIEKKIKKKLTPQPELKNFFGRGIVFLYLKRLLGIEIINKKIWENNFMVACGSYFWIYFSANIL